MGTLLNPRRQKDLTVFIPLHF